MLRSKLKSATSKLGAAAAAVLLLLLSAAALTFGFFLSLSLLVVAMVCSLFGRTRTASQDDSVIDLSKADYRNVSQ